MGGKNIKYLICGVMALCAVAPAYPQAPGGFEEFRKGLLDNFNSFKSRILEHYADFLAGEWHEYESLEAEQKYTEPKPEAIPVAEILSTEDASGQQKEMLDILGFTGKRAENDSIAAEEPASLRWLRDAVSLYNASRDEGEADSIAGDAAGDIVSADGIVADFDGEIFNFYGMKFGMPSADFTIRDRVSTTMDYAYQWNELVKQDAAAKVTDGLRALQTATGLSDYLMFEMIVAYLDGKFPEADDASKLSATHYLLTHMGFGVRIAMDQSGNPYILLPFTEKIFGRAALPLSKTFYVFSKPGVELKRGSSLSSPYLPDNAEQGESLSLRMEGLNLPVKPFHYSFEHEGIKLEGEMNENVIPMLYRYPQMDTGGFAATMISPEVRREVVRQVKDQLGAMDPLQAADKLLSMIQFSFPYATDDNFHGFEKPYFFEEILYYPKSDCEDRSVFYSYLVWHALGLETDLIAYPGHEATAIMAEKVWGGSAHYTDGGRKYFISDPTFQGAPTGQCMRRFLEVTPTVDLRYSGN